MEACPRFMTRGPASVARGIALWREAGETCPGGESCFCPRRSGGRREGPQARGEQALREPWSAVSREGTAPAEVVSSEAAALTQEAELSDTKGRTRGGNPLEGLGC